jgi:hypothetical protein
MKVLTIRSPMAGPEFGRGRNDAGVQATPFFETPLTLEATDDVIALTHSLGYCG